MDAGGRVHTVVFERDRRHLSGLFEVAADRHHAHHAGGVGLGDLGNAVGPRVDMAVLIDPGHT